MEDKVPSLDSLPFEIIEYILHFDILSFRDICRLSSVSQLFNCIGKSNRLWQNKYSKKWPKLTALYDAQNTDWKHEFSLRYEYKLLIAKKLEDMSVEFYHQDNVSNEAFLHFKDMCYVDPLSDNIVIDELESVIHDSNSHLNLTHKYYAKRALRYMRHKHLENVWHAYLSQSPNKMSLVEGACLIAQWCQPTRTNCTSDVNNQLNAITEKVFEMLKRISPQHPVVKTGICPPGDDTLEKSLWSPAQCRVILSCINTVMFQEMKFCGNKDDFYCAKNTFIDKVLTKKTGIPITLGIVYAAIAARLGVACLSVNFPGHFLLKWLEHPQLSGDEAYTYIDVFENGTFKCRADLNDLVPGYQTFSDSWYDAVPPIKVFIRMCWNLVEVGRQLDGVGEGLLCLCNALELLSILSPDDMEHKLLLARVYMHLCINVAEVIALLQEISANDPMSAGIVGYMYQSALTTLETQKIRRQTQKLKLQLRDEAKDVKFTVGMIMKHKKYSYRCVIYGWDNVCTASKDWIKQMGVYNLSNKDKQPFYHVLVDDGTNRYAAQENLEIDIENKSISHIEVGRYFESYHGNYYYPNEQKRSEYPQDIEARERLLSYTEIK